MLKTFKELYDLDVSAYVKKRKAKDDEGRTIEVAYLPWATCKKLLHDNGAENVYFEPVTNANGSSLIMANEAFTDKNGIVNRCYEVRVRVVIDELEFEAQFPLMNGSNPVKDNSLTQQRLWNAQTRAFVKGVAMRTGLGFKLWLGESDDTDDEENLDIHDIGKIKERMQQEYTQKLRKVQSTKAIAEACGTTEKHVKEIFGYFDEIKNLENAILAI